MIDFFQMIGGAIMTPLYYAISADPDRLAQRVGQHLRPRDPGIAWVLSIIGLTLVIRAALIPLFVKQIKSSRNMQLIQPKVKELQKKYGHDRERLAAETMNLYRDSGTNPFASCVPILLQMPIFLALFRLIDQAAKNPHEPRGFMTVELNEQFGNAVFLGAKISDTFLSTDLWNVRVLAAGPGRGDDRHHVHHPAPADEQEHAGRRADRAVRPAAEAAALRAAGGLRRRWHRVPDRRPLLLDHLEPVDDGPAVLRDPQQPGAGDARLQGQAGPRRREGAAQGPAGGRRDRHRHAVVEEEKPRPQQRQQPKKQTRSQRKKQTPQHAAEAGPEEAGPNKPASAGRTRTRSRPTAPDRPPSHRSRRPPTPSPPHRSRPR